VGNKRGTYSIFTLRFKDIMVVVIGKPITNLKIIMEVVDVMYLNGKGLHG
jgi:hypothetical protein